MKVVLEKYQSNNWSQLNIIHFTDFYMNIWKLQAYPVDLQL